ncbi:hypothetical protein [uncultured Microbacterium sp.]|uniref:hypothetical protein n=1 Tax=uncultured Microbacterium sp. TaxID=191216 RepID=UPI0028D6B396|nr:hypothetical protein [uncultured Microbacterium sp.]
MRPANGGDFWRTHVWKRRRQLSHDTAPWVALGLAVAFTAAAPSLPVAAMPVTDLADAGLLYAALSFAAAIAGVGIAFGVPGAERIQRWSTLRSKGSDFAAFSDLAFVFTWAAMVQVAVVIVSFLAIVFGRDATVIPAGVSIEDAPMHYLSLLFSVWLWWYALFELTAVIRTVMQVTNAIVTEESS